jgi:hypothetical protein
MLPATSAENGSRYERRKGSTAAAWAMVQGKHEP